MTIRGGMNSLRKIDDLAADLAASGINPDYASKRLKEKIVKAYLAIEPNRCRAAQMLGIHRNTVLRLAGRKR